VGRVAVQKKATEAAAVSKLSVADANVLADIPKKSPSPQGQQLIRGGFNVKTYVTNKF
jgi:hypothetical protein